VVVTPPLPEFDPVGRARRSRGWAAHPGEPSPSPPLRSRASTLSNIQSRPLQAAAGRSGRRQGVGSGELSQGKASPKRKHWPWLRDASGPAGFRTRGPLAMAKPFHHQFIQFRRPICADLGGRSDFSQAPASSSVDSGAADARSAEAVGEVDAPARPGSVNGSSPTWIVGIRIRGDSSLAPPWPRVVAVGFAARAPSPASCPARVLASDTRWSTAATGWKDSSTIASAEPLGAESSTILLANLVAPPLLCAELGEHLAWRAVSAALASWPNWPAPGRDASALPVDQAVESLIATPE